MKKLILIAMAALVIVSGCKKNDVPGTVVKASIGKQKNDFSKTSLVPISESEAEIRWIMGDKILVNNGTDSQVFTLYDGDNTKTGIFNCQEDYTFGTENVAVYPAANATISGTTVSLNLPATQHLISLGTFGNGANPMACTFSNPNSLTFTSLCGVLGLSLTGEDLDITGIEIISNKDEKLNGEFVVDLGVVDTLKATANNSGTNRVMLQCPTTLTTEAKNFYIVLPVGTLSEGFTMKVYNGDEFIFSTSTAKNISIELNMVNPMAPLEVTTNYVNLGLPSGLLWAKCNLGATTPEGYGDYFAWGETTMKGSYKWNTYQYCMGSGNTLTKYCNLSNLGYNGFTDNLTTLEPIDDAATANWGDSWRMPTKAEFEELLNNTTVTWTTQNGVNGWLFTANDGSGNSLFLPAAGNYWEGELYNANDLGQYWSSSLNTDFAGNAWCILFTMEYCRMDEFGRYYGNTVRPVHEPTSGWKGGTMGYESFDIE